MADRVLAGVAAVHFAYRRWSGWGAGTIYDDGDDDIHAGKHPMAFVLTALSLVMVVGILLIIALGPNAHDLVGLLPQLWKI